MLHTRTGLLSFKMITGRVDVVCAEYSGAQRQKDPCIGRLQESKDAEAFPDPPVMPMQHRDWRICGLFGLKTVPCLMISRDLNDKETGFREVLPAGLKASRSSSSSQDV